MNRSRQLRQLEKRLVTVLGRRPDRYGLVPDVRGFVRIKDLLKAMAEESGGRSLRTGDLQEILLTMRPAQIEIEKERIRAVDRSHLTPPQKAEQLPALLYIGVRRRAHRHVFEKGLASQPNGPLVLSSDPEMARRIGGRKDDHALMVQVPTRIACRQGIEFKQTGETLFTTEAIPPSCLVLPPLPKEKNLTEREAPFAEPIKPPPGSFFLEEWVPEATKEEKRRRKDAATRRKKERSRARKFKYRGR